MFTKGHIILKGTIQEWGWYHDPKMLAFWIHLIVEANFKDGDWEGITIRRGELVTTLPELAKDVGITLQEVRTILKRLGASGEVRSRRVGKRSILTICNYDSYQTDQQDDNTIATQCQHDGNTESTRLQHPIIEEGNKGRREERKITIEVMESVERLYALYPSKCPISRRTTGKGAKDKRKLESLLRTGHTEEEIASAIRRYVKESIDSGSYIKNFQTFLNNLPIDDSIFSQQQEPEPPVLYQSLAELEAARANKRK